MMETHDTPAPVTPPTDPIPVQRVQLGSSWPGVIGTICIIFGALGLLGGAVGLLGPLMISFVEKIGGPETADAMAAVKKWEWWTYVSSGLSIVIAALLLAGGIMLLRRGPRSRSVLLTWAALKFAFGAVGSVLNGFMQVEIQSSNPAPPGMGPGFMTGVVLFSSLIGFLWIAALPLFLAIWLTRPNVKAEVSSWGTPNVRSV